MTLIQNIEIGNDSLTVTFEAFPEWNDESYTDEFGVVRFKPVPYLEQYPTWDRKSFTFFENLRILGYLMDNLKKIEGKFHQMLIEETIPDNY